MSDKYKESEKDAPESVRHSPGEEQSVGQKVRLEVDDPKAWQRVQNIMASPGYRQPDRDADFLQAGETRSIRLGLDYLKSEVLLQRHGVESTIVVFGSTRIPEPEISRRHLAAARKAQSENSDDAALQKKLSIAERVEQKSRYYVVARDLGRLIGRSGKDPHDCRISLVTGGGPGIMEAANRGAFDVGAKSIGLNISLPQEQYPNPYISPELCFQYHYFAVRKLHFMLRAKALVAFPGGYGTLDELFEALTLIQTGKITPMPVVLVGETYWRRAVDVDFLVDEGVIEPGDRALFWFAETAEDIWKSIQAWHHAAGNPLISENADE